MRAAPVAAASCATAAPSSLPRPVLLHLSLLVLSPLVLAQRCWVLRCCRCRCLHVTAAAVNDGAHSSLLHDVRLHLSLLSLRYFLDATSAALAMAATGSAAFLCLLPLLVLLFCACWHCYCCFPVSAAGTAAGAAAFLCLLLLVLLSCGLVLHPLTALQEHGLWDESDIAHVGCDRLPLHHQEQLHRLPPSCRLRGHCWLYKTRRVSSLRCLASPRLPCSLFPSIPQQ